MRKVGCFGVILALVAIVALFLVVQGWGGAGPAARTLTVQVPQGSSLAAAATERGIGRWHLSLSHDGGIASAMVVAEAGSE